MHKKIIIIFIVLFCLILSLSFILESSDPFRMIRLTITGLLYQRTTETNFPSAINRMIEGENEILIKTAESNICYWITPTIDKGYYLEVKKYYSENNDCYGRLLEKKLIPTDKPIGIIGRKNCICSSDVIIERIDEKTGTFFRITSTNKLPSISKTTTTTIQETNLLTSTISEEGVKKTKTKIKPKFPISLGILDSLTNFIRSIFRGKL